MESMRNMGKKLLLYVSALSLLPTLLFPAAALAARGPDRCYQGLLGFPHWYEYLDLDSECKVVGPADSIDSSKLEISAVAVRVVMAIIDILMRIGGIVAFIFIVVSGFKFVLSQGDPSKEKDARETAINAVIGLVITIFAIGIITFIGGQISQ